VSERRFAVIAGGGTAGHVHLALAVAEALADRGHPKTEITLVGSRRGQESVLLADKGFPFQLLPGRGIARRLAPRATARNAAALAGLGWATLRSAVGLARRRPRVVVSVGGYASLPAGLAALALRVPLVNVTHDAVPGATGRLLGRFASANAVAFTGTPLPRTVLTGVPVRSDIHPLSRSAEEVATARSALGLPLERSLVAIFGGSLGAGRLNDAGRSLAAHWAQRDDVSVLLVAGRRNFDALGAPEASSGRLAFSVVPFVEDMASLYGAADVVVCRAGALSVAELALAGVPAVLVPLPGAPDDHQTLNARGLADAGAAILLPDAECTGERLAEILSPLLADQPRLTQMAAAARGLGHPNAAARVAELVEINAA
jgi:UDP-N-acetylglucosamine--N-acetylmuramyl-(pentapeptide) pyrophosphoryl-undecaprenol N-acetylglucosamine transferase